MIDELIERVRGLTGPDREVDESIAFHTHFRPENGLAKSSFDAHEKKHDYGTAWIAHAPFRNAWGIPPYTASLDAAVALVERVLPGRGHGYLPGFYKDHNWAGIIPPTDGSVDLLTATISGGPTPAIALILALLYTLKAKEARTEAWPAGCHAPRSCIRHMACMYTNCRYENLPIKADIEAAIQAKEARDGHFQ